LLAPAFPPRNPLLHARVLRFSFTGFIPPCSGMQEPRFAFSAWPCAGHGAPVKKIQKMIRKNLTQQERRYNMTAVIKN
jgi:hypothetical protein